MSQTFRSFCYGCFQNVIDVSWLEFMLDTGNAASRLRESFFHGSQFYIASIALCDGDILACLKPCTSELELM